MYEGQQLCRLSSRGNLVSVVQMAKIPELCQLRADTDEEDSKTERPLVDLQKERAKCHDFVCGWCWRGSTGVIGVCA